ncbi:MAG TPA: WGR domain-containing protein, partial [Acidimicrobiales bacterium]|nr:WGR domain-containing protein [Acidimicrobiales bacterium]
LPARRAAIPAAPTPAHRPTVVAAASFRQRVVLASVDPARNRARCYVLTWQPGLWGGGALTRVWGRIGRPGRSLTTTYDDRDAAQALITDLLRRRFRHGYRVVDWE